MGTSVGPTKIGTVLLALVAAVLCGLGAGACGGAGKGAGASSRSSAAAANGRAPASGPGTGSATDTKRGSSEPESHYVNDRDNDPSDDNDPDDHDGTKIDDDNDGVEDHLDPGNALYHDRDDANVIAFGSLAGSADIHTITMVVRRYYAIGAADDGAKACSMMVKSTARSVVEDYGSAYLRAKTCGAIMSLLFKHVRGRFTGPFTVTSIRVKGDEAYALLGSRTTPASYIMVKREDGLWKIGYLLGGPLP